MEMKADYHLEAEGDPFLDECLTPLIRELVSKSLLTPAEGSDVILLSYKCEGDYKKFFSEINKIFPARPGAAGIIRNAYNGFQKKYG